jgi:hypothetical protein
MAKWALLSLYSLVCGMYIKIEFFFFLYKTISFFCVFLVVSEKEPELRVARAGHLTCTPRPFACTAHPRGFESRADSGVSLIERVPSPTDRRAGRRRAMRPDEHAY